MHFKGENNRVLAPNEPIVFHDLDDIFEQNLQHKLCCYLERCHLGGQGVAVVDNWFAIVTIPAIELLQVISKDDVMDHVQHICSPFEKHADTWRDRSRRTAGDRRGMCYATKRRSSARVAGSCPRMWSTDCQTITHLVDSVKVGWVPGIPIGAS